MAQSVGNRSQVVSLVVGVACFITLSISNRRHAPRHIISNVRRMPQRINNSGWSADEIITDSCVVAIRIRQPKQPTNAIIR